MYHEARVAGDARGGRGASVHLLEQLRGIGRKCAFYNGFAGSVPKKSFPCVRFAFSVRAKVPVRFGGGTVGGWRCAGLLAEEARKIGL